MSRPFTVNVAWTAASSLVENVTGVLIFFIVARLIGTEAFGIAAMAFAFIFVGEFLVRDTVTEAIIERRTLEEGRLEATFAVLVGVSVLVVLALWLVAPAVASLYGEAEVASLLMVASPVVLMIGLSGVSTALLRRSQEFRTLAIRDALAVVAGGVVCLGMAVAGFGAWSLIAQRLVQIGTSAVLSVLAAGWFPRRLPRRAELALVRGLGPNVVVLRTTSLIITQTPTVVLGYFTGPALVGLYAFAFRLIELITTLVVFPLRGVAQSAFAELRRQTGSTDRFFLDVTEITALLGFAAFAGLAIIAEPAVRLVVGEDWIGAAPILSLLCLAGAFNALVAIQEAYVLATDNLRRFLTAAGIEVVVGLLLVGFAGPYGLAAVAGAVVVRSLVAFPIRTRQALTSEDIPWARYLVKLVRPAVVAIGMGAVVGAWRFFYGAALGDAYVVLSSIMLGVVCFLGLVLMLLPGTASRLVAMAARRG